MEYTETILDRRTGELVAISAGDWLTVTELGDKHGVSRVMVRAILRKMGFLYVTGGRAHNRHHLMPWAITQGLGKHVPAQRKGQYPFDVIGPEGQEWVSSRWPETLKAMEAEQSKPAISKAELALQAFKNDRGRHTLGIQGSVLWLLDHYPNLTHTEIATLLGVTQQLVSRYASLRSKQVHGARLRRDTPLSPSVKVLVSVSHPANLMAFVPSGGARCITYVHNTSENAAPL